MRKLLCAAAVICLLVVLADESVKAEVKTPEVSESVADCPRGDDGQSGQHDAPQTSACR